MSEPSALTAADRAIAATGRDLFGPFRIERWLVLAFVAFLDQCGRSGGPNMNFGGGSGDAGDGQARMQEGLAWLAEHALLAAGIAAAVLTFIVLVLALVMWLQSRGTFMYLDNVATGRADVGRPWREHRGRAGSYFAWLFGFYLFTFMAVLALLVPMGWSGWTLMRQGPQAVPIVVLAASVVALLVLVLGSALFALALRDFVAPLQWYEGVSCTRALRRFFGLLAANKLLFLVYGVLKIVFSIVVAVVGIALCCFTCCIGLLPVIHQFILQPVYYFERRWSLEVLRELGFEPPVETVPLPPIPPVQPPLPDVPPPAPPPPPPPPAPPAGEDGGPQGFARDRGADADSRFSIARTAPSTPSLDVSTVWVALP